MGIVHAGAGTVEAQTMVRALHDPIGQLAEGEGREAMRASIGEHPGNALGVAKQHQWLVQDAPAEEALAAHFVVPCGDIPRIAQKAHVLPRVI
jgi:hypothetical protein